MALLYSTLPPLPRGAKIIYRRTAGGCPVESAEGRVQSAECRVLSGEPMSATRRVRRVD